MGNTNAQSNGRAELASSFIDNLKCIEKNLCENMDDTMEMFREMLIAYDALCISEGKKNSINTKPGNRIVIPVSAIEFNVGGNTMWVQSNIGATTLRIKCSGKINVDRCASNPVSHSDMLINGDINVCLSTEAKNG